MVYKIVFSILFLFSASFGLTIEEFYFKVGEGKYLVNLSKKVVVKIKPDFLKIKLIPLPEEAPIIVRQGNSKTFEIEPVKYFKTYDLPVILEDTRHDKIFTIMLEINKVSKANEEISLNIDDAHLGGDIIIDKFYPRTLIFDNGCQGKIGNRKVCRDMFGNYIIK